MTAEVDERFLERAIGRIYRVSVGLGVGGCLATGAIWGWRAGLGFLLGAGVSVLSFHWMHQMVDSLAPGAPPPRKRLFWFIGLRYLIFGGCGYVIVKVFGIHLPAAVAGLLVAAGAVVLEILYELLYART